MKRWLKRWGLPLVGGASLLVAAILLLSHWMGTSATGTVSVGTPAAETQPKPQPVTVQTAYFNTVLPAGFNIKRQTETPSAHQTFLQLQANTPSLQDEQFAATVGTMPAAGLDDVGDYHLRVSDTTTYAPYHPVNLPTGAVAFRSTGGALAFVLFWPHGSRYVELGFSSDGGTSLDQLQLVYTSVLVNWQWR